MAESTSQDGEACDMIGIKPMGHSRRTGKRNELDERQALPAWKLREMMKNEGRPVYKPKAVSRTPLRQNESLDPSLPPAFRAAAVRQRKKDQDDFMSLDSVHSAKTQRSRLTHDESDSDHEDSDSLSDEDSFASLGENEQDDEAYREGRNQIARQTVECSQPTRPPTTRLKKGSIISRPLDFIAE